MNLEHVAQLRKKANALPQEPGVYLMKDKGGTIIYVGKAKSLKNRVTSYFRAVESHQAKVYAMVEHVEDFDYIVTDSEFEALVLECSLIKLHTPKYNILLKDDKGYHYIKISPGPYGRISAEKQRTDKTATYLGPYTSSVVVKQTVDEANKAFMLPTCSRQFPRDLGKGRPCLNYHIKQCMGVCTGRISPQRYQEAMDEAISFMRKGGAGSVEGLTKKMEEAAEELDFERAARYRDRIAAIEKIGAQQKVMAYNHENLDVVAAVQGEDSVYLSVLIFREGRLRDKKDFTFDYFESVEHVVEEFLLSYYLSLGRGQLPKEIFLESDVEDRDMIAQVISEHKKQKVIITVPARGKGREVAEMAKNNAAQTLARGTGRSGRELSAVAELGQLLGMQSPPAVIEAYDISNYGGQTIVGGMVVFENGRPQRKFYKRFTIRDQVQPDDYAAMAQMLSRRLERYLDPEKKDPGFDRLPDLWLIDGGAGHVSVAKEVLRRHELELPVFGMVKDSRHRTRAVSSQDEEIAISANRGVFSLVTAIQDEVHRYSVEFSRNRHGRGTLTSRLLSVEGIGEVRATKLLRHFKTQKAMAEATLEELEAAPGMTKTAAGTLFAFLHPGAETKKELTDGTK